MFEDAGLNEKATAAVEKQIHYGGEEKVEHDEGQPAAKSIV